jgi:hypothetical protein
MPNNSTSTGEPVYPRSVLLHLRGFRQPLRGRVRHFLDNHVIENGIECVSLDDLHLAIDKAFSEMKADSQVEPNVAFCAQAMQQYEAGQWQDIDDVIADLQGTST